MFSKKIRGKPQRSFALELNLQYTLFFIIAASILFYIAYKNIYDYVLNRDKQALAERVSEYKDWYEGGSKQRLNQRFRSASSYEQQTYYIRITDFAGDVFFHTDPNFPESYPYSFSGDKGLNTVLFPIDHYSGEWLFAADKLSDGLVMHVGKNVNDSIRLLIQMRNTFILIMIGSSLLVFSGGAYMTRLALQPVKNMTQIAQNIIATGNLDDRVPSHRRRDELDNLALLFNSMFDRNQSLIRSMREALDNVGHDLRTPMTRLRSSMEWGIQADKNDIERMREALEDGLEESERVLMILKVLMDVSEAEAGMLKLHKENFNAKVLVERVMDLYELVAEDAGVILKSGPLIDLQICADQTRLGQVLSNLVDNAVKYTPEKGTVTVSMENNAEFLSYKIEDTGIGIPDNEQSKIWQRLYRCDASRSKKGLGLGLCMVKAVVEAHGGVVELVSVKGKGSCFAIRLPHDVLSS